MSPILLILFSICGIVLYGNGLPYPNIFIKHDYENYDDDYYLFKKSPKVKVKYQPKDSDFTKNLPWFPEEKLKIEQHKDENKKRPEPTTPMDIYPFFPWELTWKDLEGLETTPMSVHNCHDLDQMKRVLVKKIKDFSQEYKFMKNWRMLKNKSSNSVHKVKAYLRRKHIKEVLKNFTHPLRYRGCKNGNVHRHYPKHYSLDDDFGSYLDYLGPSYRIHPKSSHVELIRFSTTTSFPNLDYHFSFPRNIKVIIDTDVAEKPAKVERSVNEKSHTANIEGDSNNSTNVLETAGEMASDLAGRVTSLWHCVLGSHRIPETRDVKFFLYTRRNIIQPELLKVNYDLINKKVKLKPEHVDVECVDLLPEQIGDFERISDEKREIIKSNFLNVNAPTKILIHGYTESYKDSRMVKIKDAYLKNGRYNVIQVDWELLAAPPCYIRVTHHSKFVGETIAQFLNGLYLVGLNMSLVHLVGFSLGAQVAGFAGNNSTITPLCRITGLDPALPLFLHTQPSGHLDRLDAKFVDVIHTCGGILAMLDPLGHVDFYPNGGTRQPGCEFSNLKCSHSRAPQYFAESVVSQKKFTGQLCLTWEEYIAGDCNNATDTSFMGEPCSRRSVFGKYYLLTKSKEPFVL